MAALQAHLEAHSNLDNVVVMDVDLSENERLILAVSTSQAVFLSCNLTPLSIAHVYATGGIVFPCLFRFPFHPFRTSLYSIEELMEGYVRGETETFFTQTRDSKIFKHYNDRLIKPQVDLLDSLAERLHDHALDVAVGELLRVGDRQLRCIGIMGGHSLSRTDKQYTEVAHLGWMLAKEGYFIATGGGPGAMEAANLGAYLSIYPKAAVDEAVEILKAAPHFKHPDWLETAFKVKDRFTQGGESLAVPTWFYGHEPTNLFARHIAKYFANSIREDGLLNIALAGVIFAPGSAGTMQEIFQDACHNHYGTTRYVSPMIFLGQQFWTETRPVLPLLLSLAEGKQYAEMTTLVDTGDAALAFVRAHPPVPYEERRNTRTIEKQQAASRQTTPCEQQN